MPVERSLYKRWRMPQTDASLFSDNNSYVIVFWFFRWFIIMDILHTLYTRRKVNICSSRFIKWWIKWKQLFKITVGVTCKWTHHLHETFVWTHHRLIPTGFIPKAYFCSKPPLCKSQFSFYPPNLLNRLILVWLIVYNFAYILANFFNYFRKTVFKKWCELIGVTTNIDKCSTYIFWALNPYATWNYEIHGKQTCNTQPKPCK